MSVIQSVNNYFLERYYEAAKEYPSHCAHRGADRYQVLSHLHSLIHQPITFALDQYEGLALTSPEIQGLVAAHTDSQLLNFFKEEAGFFRGIGRT